MGKVRLDIKLLPSSLPSGDLLATYSIRIFALMAVALVLFLDHPLIFFILNEGYVEEKELC